MANTTDNFNSSLANTTHHLIKNTRITALIRIWMSFVLPCLIGAGLLLNPIIIIIMNKKKVSIKNRMRFYYTTLACGDVLTLLIVHFGQGYLGDGLKWATSGAYYIYIPRLSSFLCKFGWAAWFCCLIFSNYTLMLLSFERCMFVCFPFWARKFFTWKNTIICWSLLTLPSMIFLSALIWMVNDLVESPYTEGGIDCLLTPDHPLYYINCIPACIIVFTIHCIVIAICNIIITTKLNKAASRRNSMSSVQIQLHQMMAMAKTIRRLSAVAGLTSKEVHATITLTLISTIQCLLYIPKSVFCFLFCHFSSDTHHPQLSTSEMDLRNDIGHLNYLFTYVCAVGCVINIFVYIARVPSFRSYVLCALSSRSDTSVDLAHH